MTNNYAANVRVIFPTRKKPGFTPALRLGGWDESPSVLPPQPPSQSHVHPSMSATTSGFRGQGKNWMFTINNPTDADDPTTWEKRKYLAYQREVGESGTTHYQGYVQFTTNFRIAALKLLNPRAHWELRQGTHEQALAYVTKQETRAPGDGNGPWILGDPPAPGKRNDLQLAINDVCAGMSKKDLITKYGATWARNYRALDAAYYIMHDTKRVQKTRVTVVYGPSGTGKSRYAHSNYPDAYVLRPPEYGQPVWWCGYRFERTVIFDDFSGWIPYRTLLQLLDQYSCSVPVKGRDSVQFNSEEIIITSNIEPSLWYPNENSVPLCRRLDTVAYVSRDGRISYDYGGPLPKLAVLTHVGPDGRSLGRTSTIAPAEEAPQDSGSSTSAPEDPPGAEDGVPQSSSLLQKTIPDLPLSDGTSGSSQPPSPFSSYFGGFWNPWSETPLSPVQSGSPFFESDRTSSVSLSSVQSSPSSSESQLPSCSSSVQSCTSSSEEPSLRQTGDSSPKARDDESFRPYLDPKVTDFGATSRLIIGPTGYPRPL